LLVKAGLTPLEALTVATRNGARLLRIDTQRGTLEPGKRADFVLLSGDPSVDIFQTESIVSVWQNGVRLGE
jgi:imidazolonepropionase-like amidohydrolase